MTDNSADIIVLNGSDKQSVELLWQQEVVLDIDATLFYIKSGEKEIQNYVDKVAKPNIENFTREYTNQIVDDVLNKQSVVLINSYLNSTAKPEISEYTAKILQPYFASASADADAASKSAKAAADSAKNANTFANQADSSRVSAASSANSAASSANSAAASAQKIKDAAAMQGDMQELQKLASQLQQEIGEFKAYRYVVETYTNGSEWYCRYSDGWIEQGGIAAAGSAITVNLLAQFTNINYIVVATSLGTNGELYGQCINKDSISQITFYNFGGSTTMRKMWRACGF